MSHSRHSIAPAGFRPLASGFRPLASARAAATGTPSRPMPSMSAWHRPRLAPGSISAPASARRPPPAAGPASRRGRRLPRPEACRNRGPDAVNDPFLSSDEVNESFKASRSPAASAHAR
jgi:hypothetical protein